MIQTVCFKCNKSFYIYPSRLKQWKRHFCSKECRDIVNNAEVKARGIKTRYKVGHHNPIDRQKAVLKMTGSQHPLWKGDSVGYRGLHCWLNRELGKPKKCSFCGKEATRPKMIQWANIDHKYRRVLTDYISLCSSCHKKYDIKLKLTN